MLKILDHSSKDAMQYSNKHSLILRMFMSSTLEASVFMGKEYSENLRSIKNTGNNLTIKQMFDISEKLIIEQSDEIYGHGVQLIRKTLHGNIYLWLVMKQVISLSHAKVYVFSDSGVVCLGKIHENPNQTLHGNKDWRGSKEAPEYRTLDRIDGKPIEFELNIFSGFHHVAAQSRSLRVTVEIKWKHQKILHDGSSSCRCSTTSHGDLKTMNRNAN